MSLEHCPVCYSNRATFERSGVDLWLIACPVCGKYEVTDTSVRSMDSITEQRLSVYLLQGVLRTASETGEVLRITSDSAPSLIAAASPPQDPLDAIDRLVLWVHARTGSFANTVAIQPQRDYPVVFARDHSEFSFLLKMARDIGVVELPTSGNVRLTLDGWRHVDELRRRSPASDHAFVAMWFNDSMTGLWDQGIRPALQDTGYKAFRIDKLEHNDRIDDRILAEIRRSALLVADFTGHRGGVYFEAGFALGLGIPVIWMCAKHDLESAHFDTRQYNHIDWATEDEARARLRTRIEALGLSRNR